MIELQKIMFTALLGILGGLLGSWYTTKLGYGTKKREKENEMMDKLKLQYLQPLSVATKNLYDRLVHIKSEQLDINKCTCLRDGLKQVLINMDEDFVKPDKLEYKYIWRDNEIDYAEWVNGYGSLTLSTLRITAVYFYQASKILQDLPYVQLSAKNDESLQKHLETIKGIFGGKYGVFEEIQDSLGEYLVKENGKIKNYKEFCFEIFDEKTYYWFSPLVKFFNGFFDGKPTEDIDNMIKSLENLKIFLDSILIPSKRGRSRYQS